MQTRYKYIYFDQLPALKDRKTKSYLCRSIRSAAILGAVKWYGPWRQYCFFPMEDTVFNTGCLENINDFIRQLMAERRKG